jgi:translation initiation factor eIF-2B subunit alpha
MATAVAAIRILIAYIEASDAATLSELRDGIKSVIDVLTCSMPSKITSVSSGCELFLRCSLTLTVCIGRHTVAIPILPLQAHKCARSPLSLSLCVDRFITLKIEASHDFALCKKQLIDTGNVFLRRATMGRDKITRKGMQFVHDGSRVLTHSCSRVVLQLLIAAAKEKKRFTVFVTESRPYCQGHSTARQLGEHGIPVTVIPDAAVGHMLEKVQFGTLNPSSPSTRYLASSVSPSPVHTFLSLSTMNFVLQKSAACECMVVARVYEHSHSRRNGAVVHDT